MVGFKDEEWGRFMDGLRRRPPELETFFTNLISSVFFLGLTPLTF
jgi:hypothetical protein